MKQSILLVLLCLLTNLVVANSSTNSITISDSQVLTIESEQVQEIINTTSLTPDGWETLGLGLDSKCYAISADNNGNVYAGGSFCFADNELSLNVARWDGTEWLPVGPGLNSTCRALTTDNNGNLYAVGNFTKAGNTMLNYIGMWNGNVWTNLGEGLNKVARAIDVDQNGNVIVGGKYICWRCIRDVWQYSIAQCSDVEWNRMDRNGWRLKWVM